MLVDPMPCDVESSCDPHAVVLGDVIEEARKTDAASRAPDESAVQADRHHLRSVRAFRVEHVERVAQIAEEFVAARKSLRD